MANNTLNDLNNHLFAQLERLSDEGITPQELEKETERSKAINGVAKNIIIAAKVQLETSLNTEGAKVMPEVLGLGRNAIIKKKGTKVIAPKIKDVYDQKMEFAHSLGYDSYSAAISSMKKEEFEQRFKEEYAA